MTTLLSQSTPSWNRAFRLRAPFHIIFPTNNFLTRLNPMQNLILKPNWIPWPPCYIKVLLSETELLGFSLKRAISHHLHCRFCHCVSKINLFWWQNTEVLLTYEHNFIDRIIRFWCHIVYDVILAAKAAFARQCFPSLILGAPATHFAS